MEHRHSTVTALVWCAWGAFLLAQCAAVVRLGVDAPLSDEWSLLRMVEGEGLSIAELWEPHNHVHRLPLPRLVYFAVMSLAGWDFRAPMVFNALALGALSAAWLWAAGRARGKHSLSDIFLVLLLLRGSMSFNVLFSFQLTFLLGVLLAGGLLALFVAAPRLEPSRYRLPIAVAVVALPLAGANGLLSAIPLTVWLLAVAFGARRDDLEPSSARPYLVGAIAAGGLIAAYLWNLEPAASSEGSKGVAAVLRTTGEFLAFSLGPVGKWAPVLAGTAIFIGLLTQVPLVARRVARRKDETWSGLGLIALALSFGGIALGVGIGREGGASARYSILAAPLAAWLYLASLRLSPSGWGSGLRWSLALALALTLPKDFAGALDWARGQREVRAAFLEDVHATRGLPIQLRPDIAREHSGAPGRVQPRAERLAADLELMQDARIGPFRRFGTDHPRRTVLFVEDGESAGSALAPELLEAFGSGVLFRRTEVRSATRNWLRAQATRGPDPSCAAREALAAVDAARGEGSLVVVELPSSPSDDPIGRCAAELLGAEESPLLLWLRLAPSRPHAVLVAAWPGHSLGPTEDSTPLRLARFLRSVTQSTSVDRNR